MMSTEKAADRIRKFFYAEEVPFGLALCRICLPLVLMGMVLPRWSVCRELYSADGATAQVSVGFGYIDMLPEFSGTVVAALYAMLIFSLVTLSIGWCSRASAVVSCVLMTYFSMLDCVSTMTKYTAMVTHMLLILSLSQAGSIWSVDAWMARRRQNLDPTKPRFAYPKSAAWPRRLMQFHIAVVYFGAGVTKLHTPAFFTGDQLQYWMLTHLNYQHRLGEILAGYPVMLVAFGYVTVVFELMFIFCSWKSYWRHIVLPIGVLFHFMTTLTLGLLMFPMVCYCTYMAFIDEDDVQQSSAWLRRKIRHSSWLKVAQQKLIEIRSAMGSRPEWKSSARIVFATAFPLVALAGIQIEHQFDPYGERRPEGRYQLTAIEPERARQLLAPVTPQRDFDKFFAVDMGTFLVSDIVANRRTSFRQGENMIAQCSLIPPHEDLVIDCKIRDEENRIVDKKREIATREMFRVNMYFSIPNELRPGDYTLNIETAGRPVIKKKFQVLPKYGTVASR
ncbi:HTTM domain-containing protein [Schlesneria sp. T3-172]|uniref:HTTM domain-containing protein n=1 Tax=Schlesneria sphaerica TaxID=3373610 RepID=UPI0037C6EDE5